MTDLLPQVANTLALAALSFALAIPMALPVGLLAYRHRFLTVFVDFLGSIPWLITLALVMVVGGRKVHQEVVYEWLFVAIPIASALVLPLARQVLAARTSVVDNGYRSWARTIGRRASSVFFRDTLPSMRKQLLMNLAKVFPSAVLGAIWLAWLGFSLPATTPDLSSWIRIHLQLPTVGVQRYSAEIWSALSLTVSLVVVVLVTKVIRSWQLRKLKATRAIAARAAGLSPSLIRRRWLAALKPWPAGRVLARRVWWVGFGLEITFGWSGLLVAWVQPFGQLALDATLQWCALNVGIWLGLVVLLGLAKSAGSKGLR